MSKASPNLYSLSSILRAFFIFSISFSFCKSPTCSFRFANYLLPFFPFNSKSKFSINSFLLSTKAFSNYSLEKFSFSNYLLNANIFPSISRSFSCSNNSALGAEGKGVGFDLNYFKICA